MNNNTELPREITRSNYLLEDDENYKILVLYILRTLNEDLKQKILEILINEEIIIELEEISQLINQNWYELDIERLDLSDLDSD